MRILSSLNYEAPLATGAKGKTPRSAEVWRVAFNAPAVLRIAQSAASSAGAVVARAQIHRNLA
jgi:hypothetical protein